MRRKLPFWLGVVVDDSPPCRWRLRLRFFFRPLLRGDPAAAEPSRLLLLAVPPLRLLLSMGSLDLDRDRCLVVLPPGMSRTTARISATVTAFSEEGRGSCASRSSCCCRCCERERSRCRPRSERVRPTLRREVWCLELLLVLLMSPDRLRRGVFREDAVEDFRERGRLLASTFAEDDRCMVRKESVIPSLVVSWVASVPSSVPKGTRDGKGSCSPSTCDDKTMSL